MRQDGIEIAERLESAYEAMAAGEVDLFLTALAPGARWNLLGESAGLPFSGVRDGHDAIREMIGIIFAHFTVRDFFIEDILVSGDSAAVRWSMLAISKETGRPIAVEVFDHIVMQDGLIVSVTEFFDTAAVAGAAGRIRRIRRPAQPAPRHD